MKKILFVFILYFSTLAFGGEHSTFYNILDYGAANDGSAKITDLVKKAIDDASQTGGGTIYFPAGVYLTGPIHFKSNITIYIDAGAVLKFSDDFDDYLPMVESRWEGIDVTNFSPLFYGYKVENIAIRGRGTIDGQGKKWWAFMYEANKKYVKDGPKSRSKWQNMFVEMNKNIVKPDASEGLDRGFLRPPFIQPIYCKNILIEGITITNSPFWTINPEFCENVTVTGVTINNPISPNTDGINPSSCKYVHISNCHISVGDDCITIKSGRDKPGRLKGVPAEDYTITNCTMLSGHGGVVIGSEMSGGVKKITISNCVFDGTDRGIRIKSMRGRGGTVEDIRVSNVIMKNIRMEAIKLNMFYHETPDEPVSERTPIFRNMHFSNITAQAKQAGYLLGLKEMPIQGITFNDINIDAEIGFSIKDAQDIEFHHVQVNTENGPAVFAEQTENLEINGVKTLAPHKDTPVIELSDVKNAYFYGNSTLPGTETYLKISGENTRDITLGGNNFRYSKNPVEIASDVNADAVLEQ